MSILIKRALKVLALISLVPAAAYGGDLTLTPVLTIESRYDNNITSRTAEVKRREDYVTRITPFLDLSYSTPASSLGVSYRPTVQMYARYSEMNTVDHAALADLTVNPTARLNLTLNDTFTRTRESREASITGIQTEHDGSIWSNTVSGHARYKATPNLTVGLNASNYVIEFESPTLVDTGSNDVGANFDYGLSRKLSLTGSYTFTDYTFTPESGGTSNNQVHSALAGVSWIANDGLSVKVLAGMSASPEMQDGENWRAEASVTKVLSRGLVNLNYARATASTSGLTDSVAISDSFNLDASTSLTSTVGLGLRASYYRYELEGALRRIDSYNAGIEMSWRPSKWLALSSGFVHYQQWYTGSTTEEVDIFRDYIFVNITATPLPVKF